MANVNKAGVSPIPVQTFNISSNDIVNYLQSQVLGFSIGCDFTRWTGVTPDHSYVRMRAVFVPKDIIETTQTADYVDRILADNAAGIQFKKDVIDSLEPFVYPKTMANIRNYPDQLQRLYQYGLFGNRLDEVITYSQLTYAKESNFFRLYLRPERIIADMLADPTTNAIAGDMTITAVHGTTSETIWWEVKITNGNDLSTNSGVSIDAIFSNKH